MTSESTKILFVNTDEEAFQVSKCIAQVLAELPPVELFHASDATEALSVVEREGVDVVVLDNDLLDEKNLFIDGLTGNHPPILLQTEADNRNDLARRARKDKPITYIPKPETIDGIHQTLMLAAAIGIRAKNVGASGGSLH